jgi:hypothetical protein
MFLLYCRILYKDNGFLLLEFHKNKNRCSSFLFHKFPHLSQAIFNFISSVGLLSRSFFFEVLDFLMGYES